MPKRLRIRFQSWAMLITVLLVLGLTSVFLLTVFRTFSQRAEESAHGRFRLLTQLAGSQIEDLLEQSARFVSIQARVGATRPPRNARLGPQGDVRLFLASIETDPKVSAYFLAWSAEEQLQVTAVRGDARIQSALQAPGATHFALRRTMRRPDGTRTEQLEFLDRQGTVIGARQEESRAPALTSQWYRDALKNNALSVSEPYLLSESGEPGIAVSAPLPERAGVLASEISLRSVGSMLSHMELPPNGAIGVVDGRGQVLAFAGRGVNYAGVGIAPLTPADTLDRPLLSVLRAGAEGTSSRIRTLGIDQARYVVATRELKTPSGAAFKVVLWAPLSDFTGAFAQAQRDVLLMSLFVLLLVLPLAIIGSRRLARRLSAMTRDSERLTLLDFSARPHRPDSVVAEVNALGEAQVVLHDAIQMRTEDLRQSQEKLARLVDNGIGLSREQNRQLLMRQVLFGARDIAQCLAATLFLKTEQNTLAFVQRTSDDPLPAFEIPMFDAAGAPNDKFVVVRVATTNRSVIIDDVYNETRFDLSGTKSFSEESGLRTVSMLTVPLSPREGEVIGVIQLLNALDPVTGAIVPFRPDLITFVEALAAQSAVAIENQNLIEAQKQFMDALLRLIAGAVDAKSHYTGGHCERVPELGIMLAEAASAAQEGPLADFRFKSDDEWREFRIGAWLHDCGKVTTPEYVVDKASKLETLYNRIHEVRTRFEVLLRDARIGQLEAVAAGASPTQAQSDFEARKAQLLADFEFIAECNQGSESMADEKVQRIRRIAGQTWLRHFDDRLGLAHEEFKRYGNESDALPVTEQLLADKRHHVIPRVDTTVADPRWNFKVTVPENLYNFGEVYNLSLVRGTLTAEERFKINEHVMQTLIMLEQLPLPKNMRRVPEYAGTHHETLLGTGFPRRLGAAELSMPMRIMALADIFEALTASDRPYKKAKTLSESMRILSALKEGGHIDPDLFDLFLTSGVYLRYAERYLLPEQIDVVDIDALVASST